MNTPGGERGFAPPQNQNERQPKMVSAEEFRSYEANLYAKEAQRREVGHQVLGVLDVQPPAPAQITTQAEYNDAYAAMKARILAERGQRRGQKEPQINPGMPTQMRGSSEGADLSAHNIRASVQAQKNLYR